MSSLALMRWLEGAPGRYDTGMRVLTWGRVEALRDAMALAIAPAAGGAPEVLEIGCGTGALTRRLLQRGARVTALDQSPAMLEQARAHIAEAPSGRAELLERTASEIDALPADSFDAVAASLCLSEMSRSERRFVLTEARRRLRPGGRLVVRDEVRPRRLGERLLHALLRGPQTALGWLLAGSVSRPLSDLAGELRDVGLEIEHEERWLAGALAVFVARRPS